MLWLTSDELVWLQNGIVRGGVGSHSQRRHGVGVGQYGSRGCRYHQRRKLRRPEVRRPAGHRACVRRQSHFRRRVRRAGLEGAGVYRAVVASRRRQ